MRSNPSLNISFSGILGLDCTYVHRGLVRAKPLCDEYIRQHYGSSIERLTIFWDMFEERPKRKGGDLIRFRFYKAELWMDCTVVVDLSIVRWDSPEAARTFVSSILRRFMADFRSNIEKRKFQFDSDAFERDFVQVVDNFEKFADLTVPLPSEQEIEMRLQGIADSKRLARALGVPEPKIWPVGEMPPS
jgi:hypothetical protein